MKIETISIKEDLSLDEAERLLIQTVNFGDYLAEQAKQARLLAADAERIFDQAKEIALSKTDGRDADTRKLQAKNKCEVENEQLAAAEIEAQFIQDLLKNNFSKTEALRTIVSSKKTVWEKTHQSSQ